MSNHGKELDTSKVGRGLKRLKINIKVLYHSFYIPIFSRNARRCFIIYALGTIFLSLFPLYNLDLSNKNIHYSPVRFVSFIFFSRKCFNFQCFKNSYFGNGSICLQCSVCGLKEITIVGLKGEKK